MFQGVGSDNVPWHFTTANHNFTLCETYPKVLAVPSSCSDEDIRSVAAFRSKGRLPVSVWVGGGWVGGGNGGYELRIVKFLWPHKLLLGKVFFFFRLALDLCASKLGTCRRFGVDKITGYVYSNSSEVQVELWVPTPR